MDDPISAQPMVPDVSEDPRVAFEMVRSYLRDCLDRGHLAPSSVRVISRKAGLALRAGSSLGISSRGLRALCYLNALAGTNRPVRRQDVPASVLRAFA